MTAWNLRGEYMESCNCDYLCPCIYTNPQGEATNDHCYAALVFRIDEGICGEVRLDGLKFALMIRSQKVMAHGDWVLAGVVDADGDASQREALTAIVSGEAGGTPGVIREHLVSEFRGVEYHPIAFTMDGLKRAVSIPNVLQFAIEGVTPRHNPGAPMYLDNTAHPANSRLALARAEETRFQGFGFDLHLIGQGNNGHFAPFHWTA